MKKIIVGALVCAAVAGVVFYLKDPERFSETVDDLKDKADDLISKAKNGLNRTEDDVRSSMG